MPTPYLPGHPPPRPEPLSRFLPPVPDGVATAWLQTHLVDGLEASQRPWILDPFGTSPRLAVEAARAGFRVLVAANNPVARFLFEMAAKPPSETDLRAALAELASARRGDERLEPHIRSLYLSHCDACNAEVMVEAFIWERGVTGALHAGPDGEPRPSALRPVARIYQCPHCGEGGERPLGPADLALANQFASTGLHKARALERVAASDDPVRRNAEEALETYLPRAVYALFTLINKLDSLNLSASRREHISALLLAACDQANTLWPYPSGRARPRQLTIPPRFRENNVWLALEQAIGLWTGNSEKVPLAHWPEVPPAQGGICIFEGRLRDLMASLSDIPIGAVLTALPRPNQAFWTLSALWAGWLWGREAVGPFKNVLRRRRYDWSWHCAALHAALENLSSVLAARTPVFSLIGETEPGFLSAALIAADMAGYQLEGLALRADTNQAQITWQNAPLPSTVPTIQQDSAPLVLQAARQYLSQRGEPATYLPLHTAALVALANVHTFAAETLPPADALSALTRTMEETFTYRNGFLRYGGSEKTLDVGLWWARDLQDFEPSLADRVELELVRYLVKHPQSPPAQIDQAICLAFPGILTPGAELVHLCLESYAQDQAPGSGLWSLRSQDTSHARRNDLQEIQEALQSVARHMGLQSDGENPQVWRNSLGEVRYVFYILASAMIGELINKHQHPPSQSLIVLPGGRANLVAFKLQRDPRLRQAVEEGWRFVKYRQVRWLAENPALSIESLDEFLAQDSLTYDAPQLRLF